MDTQWKQGGNTGKQVDTQWKQGGNIEKQVDTQCKHRKTCGYAVETDGKSIHLIIEAADFEITVPGSVVSQHITSASTSGRVLPKICFEIIAKLQLHVEFQQSSNGPKCQAVIFLTIFKPQISLCYER